MSIQRGREALTQKYVALMSQDPGNATEHLVLALDEYNDQVVTFLREMISEWETKIGEDDKTLYSLGLRRAIDALTGESSV